MKTLHEAIDILGGPTAVGRICGVTRQAVTKWATSGQLPRTDYTGETRHADKMAAASKRAFTASQLRKIRKPTTPAS